MGILSATPKRCATPCCKAKGGHGLWAEFCRRCARNLARIRDELEAEAAARCPSNGNGGRTFVFPPRCCTPGREEPRKRGATFCDVCLAMGVEDEAA